MDTEKVTVGTASVGFNEDFVCSVTITVPVHQSIFITAACFDDLLEAMNQIRETVDRHIDD